MQDGVVSALLAVGVALVLTACAVAVYGVLTLRSGRPIAVFDALMAAGVLCCLIVAGVRVAS